MLWVASIVQKAAFFKAGKLTHLSTDTNFGVWKQPQTLNAKIFNKEERRAWGR